MADEFVLPKDIGKVDCSDKQTFGQKSSLYNYIVKSITGDEDYPSDACPPWVHGNFQVDNIQLNTSLTGSGRISVIGNISSIGNVSSNGGSHILSNKKNLPFDMLHPNKEGWRLRHVCIEGPEIAVYCRGKVSPDGVIDLPSFWDGLINPEDMSISLTPIGSWQELFVKEVKWGKQVIVQNNSGGQICADYYIVARRLDDDLIVEYEGKSHEDYPGGNEGYSFNFEHNYVKNLIQETIREILDNHPQDLL
jgi:hypothetical protein